MTKAYILKSTDYTLKRKGETRYMVVDENKNYVNMTGGWLKTRKAAMNAIIGKGLEFAGEIREHKNYSHWADFQFAK